MENSIQHIISTIDDAVAAFEGKMPEVQERIYNELLPIVKELEVKNGKIVNSVANLKLIGKLKNKLERIITESSYTKAVKEFVGVYNTLANLNLAYFRQYQKKYEAGKVSKAVKELAIDSTLSDLLGEGLNENLIKPIQSILKQNITTGGSYAQFQNELQNYITNTGTGEGSLQRYAKQITTDSINQYNAQYSEIIAQDLGFNWGMYVGSNITTTREFCELLTQKLYVHKSELPEIIQGNINGHQCKLSKTTDLPLGMMPGTNAANFKIRRGGYNCGHQFFWVPDNVVPEHIRNSLGKKQKPVVSAEDISEINKSPYFKLSFNDFDNELKLLNTTGKTSDMVDLSGITKFRLSKEEAKLVFTYTTHAHEDINSELYSGYPSKTIIRYEELLNGILQKLPDYSGTVLRDYTPQISIKEYLQQFKNKVGTNEIVIFEGFLSTSKNPKHNWGSKVKFNIQSKTGKLIENLSAHANEQEVLFQSMSAFKVLKVEGNTIYLEEF